MKAKFAKRFAAGASAFAVVLTGVAASGAFAAAGDAPTEYSSLAAITGTTGNVYVHKHYSGSTGLDTTGTVDGMPASGLTDATALGGVEFVLTPILCGGKAPNLKTQEGWNDITGLKVAADGTTLSKGDNAVNDTACTLDTAKAKTETTADGTNGTTKGLASFTGVDLTAYVVTESNNDTIETKTPPFIVTVPYLNANHKYITDINLYPKNVKKSSASKVPGTPTTTIIKNGTEVTTDTSLPWTVTVTVPAAADNAPAKAFWIKDVIGQYQDFNPDATITATVGSATATVTALDATGCSWDATNGWATTCQAATADSDTVLFVFNKDNSGAADYKPAVGDTVTLTFSTKIDTTELGTNTPTFENKGATVWINGTDKTPGTAGYIQDPTDNPNDPKDPTVKFVNLNVDKVAKGSTTTKLKDTKFDVYLVDENGGAIPGETDKGTKINTGAEFSTNASGAFDRQLQLLAGKSYYLIETAPTPGYQQPTTGVKVTIAKDGSITVDGALDSSVANGIVQIQNVRGALDPTMGLPITGAQGLMLLTIAGVLIIGAGVGAIVIARRRQQAAE